MEVKKCLSLSLSWLDNKELEEKCPNVRMELNLYLVLLCLLIGKGAGEGSLSTVKTL